MLKELQGYPPPGGADVIIVGANGSVLAARLWDLVRSGQQATAMRHDPN